MRICSGCGLAALIVLAAGCSSSPPPPQKQGAVAGVTMPSAVTVQHHPLGKLLEVSGFRITEAGAGKLKIRFGLVNHSDGEISDLGLQITLKAVGAKPEDPPLCTFDVKVPVLGPQELKEITGTAPTKLRIYELPDWQFIRSDFTITSPAATP